MKKYLAMFYRVLVILSRLISERIQSDGEITSSRFFLDIDTLDLRFLAKAVSAESLFEVMVLERVRVDRMVCIESSSLSLRYQIIKPSKFWTFHRCH